MPICPCFSATFLLVSGVPFRLVFLSIYGRSRDRSPCLYNTRAFPIQYQPPAIQIQVKLSIGVSTSVKMSTDSVLPSPTVQRLGEQG